MTTRSHSKSIVFCHPFELKGVDRILPSGDYRVVTDEELIEELSFPVYRRVATMIFVPAESHHASSIEMVAIDPQDLEAAQERDLNHGAQFSKSKPFLRCNAACRAVLGARQRDGGIVFRQCRCVEEN